MIEWSWERRVNSYVLAHDVYDEGYSGIMRNEDFLCGIYAEFMRNLCEIIDILMRILPQFLRKLCRFYAEIMRKLCGNYAKL